MLEVGECEEGRCCCSCRCPDTRYQLRGLEPWMKARIHRIRMEAIDYALSRPGSTPCEVRRLEPWPEIARVCVMTSTRLYP
jgi:hypothetical protein